MVQVHLGPPFQGSGDRKQGSGSFWLLIAGYWLLTTGNGGVAQLGERLPCTQEVIGSSPFTSTI